MTGVLGVNRHDPEALMRSRRTQLAAGAIVAAIAALVALAFATGSGRSAGPPPPTDRQIAEVALARYTWLLDTGRGTAFCNGAITAATLEAEGGADRCATTIDGYVHRLEKQGYQSVLLDMHYLFTMLSDGIVDHCPTHAACSSWSYGRWASETYPGEVVWKTGSDPALASSTGRKVVAVVDPASTTRWITLYYQAWDGRILKARWSTKLGSWRGWVIDTHRGAPFLSHVRVLVTRRIGDRIVARVSMRVGTMPMKEQFTLVREAGSWRVDTWRPLPAPPAA